MKEEELSAHLEEWAVNFERRLRDMGRPVVRKEETSRSYRRWCSGPNPLRMNDDVREESGETGSER